MPVEPYIRIKIVAFHSSLVYFSYPATASIVSVVLYVGFRLEVGTVAIYFIIPAVTVAKLYAISIMATFNNRPAPLSELSGFPGSVNTFEMPRKGRRMPVRQILIAQTVVRQVWPPDTMPINRESEVRAFLEFRVF